MKIQQLDLFTASKQPVDHKFKAHNTKKDFLASAGKEAMKKIRNKRIVHTEQLKFTPKPTTDQVINSKRNNQFVDVDGISFDDGFPNKRPTINNDKMAKQYKDAITKTKLIKMHHLGIER